MGLDCSHDAFSGAYSSFNRFRQAVAEATEGSFPTHYKYGPQGRIVDGPDGRPEMKPGLSDELVYIGDDYSKKTHPGLYEFLMHSDCDGKIMPKMCAKVADDLEGLLPKIEALGWLCGGHIERDGGYVAVTKKFISGCRAAAAENKPLIFA